MKLGDTVGGVWLMEVIESCVRELPGDKIAVDMNQLVHKCIAEPKNAQIAMQLMAQELRQMLKGAGVEAVPREALSIRHILGSIYLAYAVARDVEAGRTEPSGRIPEELHQILKWNPGIIQCANYVSVHSPINKP